MEIKLMMDSLDSLDNILLRCRAKFQEHGIQEVVIRDYEQSRSIQQNRLAFLWYKTISLEKQDNTPEYYRSFCKLCIGVPIRRENDTFREKYDRVIRPLSYENKIEIMGEPINFPITRDMGVKEMTHYLDGIDRMYAEQGVVLPKPEDLYYSAMGIKRK